MSISKHVRSVIHQGLLLVAVPYVTVLVKISTKTLREGFFGTYCFPPSHGQCLPHISIVTGGQNWQYLSPPPPPMSPPPPLCTAAVAAGEVPGGAVSTEMVSATTSPGWVTVGAGSREDEFDCADAINGADIAVRAKKSFRIAILAQAHGRVVLGSKKGSMNECRR